MRRIAFPLALLIASVAFADAPAGDRASELEAENARLRTELQQLREENAELRKQLDLAETRREDLTVENRRLEALAGVTAKGEMVESKAALIKGAYDEPSGQTVVRSLPERLEMSGGLLEVPHVVVFEYAFDGREMASKPDRVTLWLTAVGNARPKYKTVDALRLMVDGEPMTLPVAGYEFSSEVSGASRVGQRRYTESLRFDLAMETVRTLARARRAEARLSNVSLTVPSEVLATAKAVRERIEMGL